MRPFADGTHWVLEAPMTYDRRDGWPPIIVPRGFVTDLTSVPKSLRSFVSVVGPYVRAAVLHDYLFWTQGCTRGQADRIMYYAMIDSGTPQRKARKIYRGLKIGSERAYRNNQAERAQGLPKFLPLGEEGKQYWQAVHGRSWREVRQQMKEAGVKDPVAAEPDYCDLGGSEQD